MCALHIQNKALSGNTMYYTELIQLYRCSRRLLNNGLLEKHIALLEQKAGSTICKAAFHDAYCDTELLEFYGKKITVKRIDFMDADSLYDLIYTLKPMETLPFNILFAKRKNDISVFNVKGNSMNPILSDGDIVITTETDEIHEDKISVIEIPEGKLIKRIKCEDDGYLLISDNPVYPPMWVNRDDFKILGVVAYIVKKAK